MATTPFQADRQNAANTQKKLHARQAVENREEEGCVYSIPLSDLIGKLLELKYIPTTRAHRYHRLFLKRSNEDLFFPNVCTWVKFTASVKLSWHWRGFQECSAHTFEAWMSSNRDCAYAYSIRCWPYLYPNSFREYYEAFTFSICRWNFFSRLKRPWLAGSCFAFPMRTWFWRKNKIIAEHWTFFKST